MTECTSVRPVLKRLRRQAVEFDFEGGALTSDVGLLLSREVDRRLDLIPRLARAIPDPREPSMISHSQEELLTSRIFGIAAGYEDGNDHLALRHDPAFQVAAGRTPAESHSIDEQDPLASPATLSRFENRITRESIVWVHVSFCFFVPPLVFGRQVNRGGWRGGRRGGHLR